MFATIHYCNIYTLDFNLGVGLLTILVCHNSWDSDLVYTSELLGLYQASESPSREPGGSLHLPPHNLCFFAIPSSSAQDHTEDSAVHAQVRENSPNTTGSGIHHNNEQVHEVNNGRMTKCRSLFALYSPVRVTLEFRLYEVDVAECVLSRCEFIIYPSTFSQFRKIATCWHVVSQARPFT